MIPCSGTQYRIRYKQCTHDKQHQGESMNFVCLSPDCAEKSLICSMCRNDQHKGHVTCPLKYYIETLKKEYEGDARNFEKEFETLEESRAVFLLKLRQTVEKVAEQFRKLEEQVMERFNAIRTQISSEQAKRNKFADFYLSLVQQRGEKAEFLIQDYLPVKQLALLQNFSEVEKLGGEVSKMVFEARDTLLANAGGGGQKQKQSEKASEQIEKLLRLAKGVTKNNHYYSQTDQGYSAQTMNVLAVDLLTQFKTGKIKIRIVRLKKGGTVYLGAIRKDYFESLNYKAPQPWNGANSAGKLHYYNNQAVVYGQSLSQLKTFSEGSNMQISMSGNKMKIGMKKNSAQFVLGGGEFYFFFNLTGNVEIEMKYLPAQ